MGKVEKVVVVSVLFLITLILAVSLPGKDPKPSGADGVTGTSEVLTPPTGDPNEAGLSTGSSLESPEDEVVTGAMPGAATSTMDGAGPAVAAVAAPTKPDTLLSATVQTPAPAAGAAIPPGSILVSTEGLEESYLPDYRFYAWKQDDSWRSIAARCYGNAAMAPILRRANEGRMQVAPGEKVLVPVFAPDAAPTTGVALAGASPTRAAGSQQPAGEIAGGPQVYVVAEGDSLWKISKKVYGAGARWNEIFTANRDVLASPDDLATGQRLRIP